MIIIAINIIERRARARSIYLRARARVNLRASAHCAHICVNSRSGDVHPEKASST